MAEEAGEVDSYRKEQQLKDLLQGHIGAIRDVFGDSPPTARKYDFGLRTWMKTASNVTDLLEAGEDQSPWGLNKKAYKNLIRKLEDGRILEFSLLHDNGFMMALWEKDQRNYTAITFSRKTKGAEPRTELSIKYKAGGRFDQIITWQKTIDSAKGQLSKPRT